MVAYGIALLGLIVSACIYLHVRSILLQPYVYFVFMTDFNYLFYL